MEPEYGETWTYESIVGALPGIDVSTRAAVFIQFLVFEVAVLVLAAIYDLWVAAAAGTVAVVVASAGSVEMLRISRFVRGEAVPESYRRLLFGSSVEVVLSVLAYVALITHLFVFDPRSGTPLLTTLFGPEPPILVVYLVLLVLWDVCYRIGTGWWASVVALWRSVRYRFDPATARALQRADLETMGFGVLQLVLVPFLASAPVLRTAVVGHVLAVTVVTGTSILFLRVRTETATPSSSP
ncbi:hypothetical protein SAMN05216388_1004177 [Halorientalis persicus]|uniref:Uncharacterized protein n=1 Tax=Halorientalis persicus TaxID=1367881 RepID=A0A1H8IJ46_9EURY|nr:hypothetical protein [Halorientalis persicus]SEN68259.1 hypothetical protein SAMN05216388_1004177 [Halorientalis persicus]